MSRLSFKWVCVLHAVFTQCVSSPLNLLTYSSAISNFDTNFNSWFKYPLSIWLFVQRKKSLFGLIGSKWTKLLSELLTFRCFDFAFRENSHLQHSNLVTNWMHTKSITITSSVSKIRLKKLKTKLSMQNKWKSSNNLYFTHISETSFSVPMHSWHRQTFSSFIVAFFTWAMWNDRTHVEQKRFGLSLWQVQQNKSCLACNQESVFVCKTYFVLCNRE